MQQTQSETVKRLIVGNPQFTPDAIAKMNGIQAHKVWLWQPRAFAMGAIPMFDVLVTDEIGNMASNYALDPHIFHERLVPSRQITLALAMAGVNNRQPIPLNTWPKYTPNQLACGLGLEELWELYPLLLLPRALLDYATLNNAPLLNSFVSALEQAPHPDRLLERAFNTELPRLTIENIKFMVNKTVTACSTVNFPPCNDRLLRQLAESLTDNGVLGELENGQKMSPYTLRAYLTRALANVSGTFTSGGDKYDYAFADDGMGLSCWLNWHAVPINPTIHPYTFALDDAWGESFVEYVVKEFSLIKTKQANLSEPDTDSGKDITKDDDLPFTDAAPFIGGYTPKAILTTASCYHVADAASQSTTAQYTVAEPAEWATVAPSLSVTAYIDAARELIFGHTNDAEVILDAALQLTDREVGWILTQLYQQLSPDYQAMVKHHINSK